MTCAEASTLLDAFVDAELTGPALLDVARHAAVCTACDSALRERSALHEAVEQTMVAEAERLDLSDVWPAVSTRVARTDARRAWMRRLRAAPAWGAAAALAAGVALWVRAPTPEPEQRPVAVARTRPNHAVIERLNSGGLVDVRRERKNGTTLIMVSATDGGALR